MFDDTITAADALKSDLNRIGQATYCALRDGWVRGMERIWADAAGRTPAEMLALLGTSAIAYLTAAEVTRSFLNNPAVKPAGLDDLPGAPFTLIPHPDGTVTLDAPAP